MRKVSYYLFFTIFVGLAITTFWGYDRYFKVDKKEQTSFVVAKGDVKETVRVRGEVVSQKDFDLEFPFSGTVDNIFVKEGDVVGFGAPIIKLDTTDIELEIKQLEAQLAQGKASLAKLNAGATVEDINVSSIKVKNAEIAFDDARKNLINKIQESYLKSDNAVRNNSDKLFSNPMSSNPEIIFLISNAQLESDVEIRRVSLERTISTWKELNDTLSLDSDLEEFVNNANKNLDEVGEFLDRMALAVNGLIKNSSITQATVDGYKNEISTARSDLSTAVISLTSAEEKYRNKESDLALMNLELELKVSGSREEDIAIAEAKITETESKISIKRERVKKSTLYAPGRVIIEKIWLERSEIARAGSVVVSLASLGFKIQTDVSELEIGKFNESNGNDVLIELDAFRSRLFTGRVVSIEPRKVVKDGDTYYKVNIYLDAPEKSIRTGMSADLTVSVSQSLDTLIVPEVAIKKKDGKYFVMILDGSVVREREIKVGISDEENTEIKEGLSVGEVVIILED